MLKEMHFIRGAVVVQEALSLILRDPSDRRR